MLDTGDRRPPFAASVHYSCEVDLGRRAEELARSCSNSNSSNSSSYISSSSSSSSCCDDNNCGSSSSSSGSGGQLRVAVLLSGGVDSSLALQLLVAAGHSCTAFYLQIWFQVRWQSGSEEP